MPSNSIARQFLFRFSEAIKVEPVDSYNHNDKHTMNVYISHLKFQKLFLKLHPVSIVTMFLKFQKLIINHFLIHGPKHKQWIKIIIIIILLLLCLLYIHKDTSVSKALAVNTHCQLELCRILN